MSRKRGAKAKPALGRVLVVEDDPVLALALEDALHSGCAADVVICPSMEATMAELDKQWPDAMIIDIHLSDRDDGWALAELTGLIGTRRPRIVFSTGAPEGHPGRDCRNGRGVRKALRSRGTCRGAYATAGSEACSPACAAPWA